MKEFKLASSQVIGRDHIKNHLPCQDVTYKRKTKKFYFLALADGAGSYENSHFGASYILKALASYLENNFEKLFFEEGSSKKITTFIEYSLKHFAVVNAFAFKELSSTLQFVAVKDNNFLVGHIGDGLIGILDKENNIKVFSQAENGEFANETYFTTSESKEDRLRIKKIPERKSKDTLGFILLSDGSCQSLYSKRDKFLSKANITIINFLRDYSEEEVDRILYNNLANIISQAEGANDDCSIAIIRACENLERK